MRDTRPDERRGSFASMMPSDLSSAIQNTGHHLPTDTEAMRLLASHADLIRQMMVRAKPTFGSSS